MPDKQEGQKRMSSTYGYIRSAAWDCTYDGLNLTYFPYQEEGKEDEEKVGPPKPKEQGNKIWKRQILRLEKVVVALVSELQPDPARKLG